MDYKHILDLVSQIEKSTQPLILKKVSELEHEVENVRMELRELRTTSPKLYDAFISLLCEVQKVLPKIHMMNNLTFTKSLELLIDNWPGQHNVIIKIKKLVHEVNLLFSMIRVQNGLYEINQGCIDLVRDETRRFETMKLRKLINE